MGKRNSRAAAENRIRHAKQPYLFRLFCARRKQKGMTAIMQMRVAGKSIIGSREEQQDAYYTAFSDNAAFAVVCDGMGGTEGGAAASKTAVSMLRRLYEEKKPSEPYPDFFLGAIDILDESVVKLRGQDGAACSGTTIVAAAVDEGSLYWMAVGDSRLYIIRGCEIVQATRDHNYALTLGQWTAEELSTVRIYPGKHRADALISFIGIGGIRIYDINDTPFPLIAGDKVLLTTDGLTKTLGNDEIFAILKNNHISHALDILFADATKKADGIQDNTTCVLMQIDDGEDSYG